MQSKSVFSRLRKVAYFAGAGILAPACLAIPVVILPGFAEAQNEFFYYRQYRQPEPYAYPPEMRRRPDPYSRPAIRQPVRPKQSTTSGKQKDAPTSPGPHVLVVSIKSQRVALYANGKLVMESPISSGMATNPTPTGIFSVIQKNRHHRSNIYSGAPMPYMQRLTWSGIALHQGALPGRPASHGCIRLPEQFANYLWRTTKLGARVVISREDTAPYDVAHAKLFQPKPAPTTVETAPPLRRTLDTTTPPLTRTAGIALVVTDANAAPVETDGTKPDAAPQDSSTSANDVSRPDVAEPKPADISAVAKAEAPASQTTSAPVKTATASEPAKDQTTGSLNQPQTEIPGMILDSFAQSLEAKQKKSPPSGPISVFISRKEKQLFVRQGFVPLFTAPVSFRDEKAIFGTHVLTAYAKGDDSKELRWMAVTLPAELPHAERSRNALQIDASVRMNIAAKLRSDNAKEADHHTAPSIASVLDRIDIPQDVIDRVSEYVTAGASLIISDHGLGRETGLHTDFIVETR